MDRLDNLFSFLSNLKIHWGNFLCNQHIQLKSDYEAGHIFFPFVGELQRKIGLKVLEMRGNAVVGYLQCFDLEGESGLVVRAIGTACTLDKLSSPAAFLPACNSPSKDMKE